LPAKKSRTSQVQPPKAWTAESTPEPAGLDATRRELARIIGAAAAEIVNAAIAKAKAGQFQAMKYLFELAGIHPVHVEEGEAGDLSLAQVLCRKLGLPEENSPSADGEQRQEVSAPIPFDGTLK